MNPERWEQVKRVVDAALDFDPGQRETYLDHVCAGDPELRREVDSLLQHHQLAASGFLNRPAIDLRTLPPHATPQPSRIGYRVGVYELVEEIGEGGMGSVYRAARADGQFEKEVAIKLVRRGFDTAALIERFRNERQILASLDHPNIARLLDGGTTDDGIPYVVMELIEGTPIDVYCDAHDLSIVERLELFRPVCSAVQYAHQHLVIHRDIKPGNIIVTKDGIPKLLDFGIAKILDPAVRSETTLARPMTLAYASPEQILGQPITTASDVYALGVVLYRLLTGRSPYPEAITEHQLARAICETEPDRPSAAVIRLTAAAGNSRDEETIRRAAAVDPRSMARTRVRLRSRLSGDLDNILMKALRKEPSQRYALVEHLAEDIRRHLEGRPVTATRGSWRYRAGRFVRRHRAGVAATAAVVIALCAGIGATAREARIARRQADIARTQKARAEKRFNDVRKLSDSLIFDVHDAIQGLPGATPARRLLLDRAVEYLDSASKDAAGDPDLQRELGWGYQRLAVVQGSPSESNLGDLDAALASDRKALALFESVAKANPADTIDQLNVAMMHRILAYSSLTDPNGRRDLDAAMTITGRLLAGGTNDPRVRSERSIEYQNLALLHDANGDRVHALDAYRKNRELKLDILRTNPDYRLIRRGLGMATVLVGTALARVGERDEALHMMDEGIGFYASLNKDGDDVNASRERAVASQKRGDILLMNGDTSGALAIYRQARRVLEPMAAADPQNTMLQLDVAGMIYHEARALARSRQYDGAIAGLQRAAAIYGKVHAPGRSADDSPRGAGSIFISLGDAYAGRGDRRAALESYGNATAALQADWRRSPDDDMRCELAVSFVKSADMLAGAGDFREASARYQQALDLLGDVVADHRDVPAWYVIADAHAGMGRLAEARARVTADLAMRSTLRAEAEAHYARSLSTWKQIPNPSRVSPSGFGAGDPKFVEAALAKLRGVSE